MIFLLQFPSTSKLLVSNLVLCPWKTKLIVPLLFMLQKGWDTADRDDGISSRGHLEAIVVGCRSRKGKTSVGQCIQKERAEVRCRGHKHARLCHSSLLTWIKPLLQGISYRKWGHLKYQYSSSGIFCSIIWFIYTPPFL